MSEETKPVKFVRQESTGLPGYTVAIWEPEDPDACEGPTLIKRPNGTFIFCLDGPDEADLAYAIGYRDALNEMVAEAMK